MSDYKDIKKLDLNDLSMFYAKLKEGVDLAEILKDSGVRYLLLFEKDDESYSYSNNLPLLSLAKIVSELFYSVPRFKEMVLKRTDVVKKLSELSENESPNESIIDTDSDIKEELIPKQEPILETKDPEEQLPPEYLKEKYDISTKTLANWRSEKRGPKYLKMGKKIRYIRKDVEKWFSENTVKTYSSRRKSKK